MSLCCCPAGWVTGLLTAVVHLGPLLPFLLVILLPIIVFWGEGERVGFLVIFLFFLHFIILILVLVKGGGWFPDRGLFSWFSFVLSFMTLLLFLCWGKGRGLVP